MIGKYSLILGVGIYLTAILACASLSNGISSPSQNANIMLEAIALRQDNGQREIGAFIGPVTAMWNLPRGTYRISAINENSEIYDFHELQIIDVPVIWPEEFNSAGGEKNDQQARTIFSLVSFLIQADLAQLAALEISSAGFSQPLFTSQPSESDLDSIHTHYGYLSAREQEVLGALDRLIATSSEKTSWVKDASPLEDWRVTFLGFFGYVANSKIRARDRILEISANMTAEEKQEAYGVLRPALQEQAGTYDELVEKLRAGELTAEADKLERDLYASVGYTSAAQGKDLSVGQVIHKEGAELVEKGAEFEVEVIKTVLTAALPDISEGFDLADKANEWAEYVENIYKNPLGAAEGELRGAMQEKIKDRILGDLKACCEDMDDDLAEDIADKLSEEAMNAVPELIPALQATQTALAGGEESLSGAAGENQLSIRDTMTETIAHPDIRRVNSATSVVLTADFDTGMVIGTLEGVGTYELEIQCNDLFDSSTIYETGVAAYDLTYTIQVEAPMDINTGEFATNISPTGVVRFAGMTQPFIHSECVEMNSDLDITFPLSGSGVINGTIPREGQASLSTDWIFLEGISVSGSWSGQTQ